MNYFLINDSFSDVSEWTNNGFTVNNGLEASGSGGMTFNAIFYSDTYLDRQKSTIEVTINDDTSKFAISKRADLAGNISTVDLNTNILYFGILNSEDVEPSYEWSTPITITINEGDTYILELSKDINVANCKFYNKSQPDTFNEITKTYGVDTDRFGSFWGNPTAIFFNGDIKILNFKYESLVNFTPKVNIYGDSFVEGATMRDTEGNLYNRWAQKLYDINNGNLIMSAKGGANSALPLTFIDFHQLFIIPIYTILPLGTNDTVFATWKSNMDSLISKAESIGSIPVLATIAPRSDRQTFINQANDELLNNYSANYDIIDFAASLTTNRDRINWVEEYLMDDDTHPTVEGQQVMYNEIVNNNNYLTVDVSNIDNVLIYKETSSAQIIVDDTLTGEIKEKTYTTAAHTYMGFDGNTVWVKNVSNNRYILNSNIGLVQNEDQDLIPLKSNIEEYLLTFIGS